MAANERQELEELRRLDQLEKRAGGNKPAAPAEFLSSQIPDAQPRTKPAPEPSLGEKVSGVREAAAATVMGMPAALAGNISSVISGDKAGDESFNLLYPQPQTKTGQDYTRKVGEALEPLQAMNPFDAAAVSSAPHPSIPTRMAPPKAVPKSTMPGMGAANTSAETLRRQRANDLPVPIDLTKGQAERDFSQQQFERETAKNPTVGEPLRDRFTEQNKKILLNFDSWVDQIGAEQPSVRGAGQTVVGAIEKKAKSAKGEINAAYEQARQAGELAQKVKTDPIVKYIEDNRPESINAPVLNSIEQKLIQLGGASKGTDGKLLPGEIPLNDLEELRKMVNRISDSTPTNMRFGREAKAVIDDSTKGAGGTIYARARRLRQRYATEFEERGVIDKMIRTKPGTSDRAVAYEDVFNHAILNGSLDDARAVRRTLQTQGEAGQQAWKELQGQTVMHLREVATKGVSTDKNGNPIISPAALNKTVQMLDKDGKLDFVFGKKGAQQIRDINDLAKDVYTSLPGSVNTSNTASVLMAALDSTISATTGLPAPLATAMKLLKEQLANRKLKKRVTEALAPPSGMSAMAPPMPRDQQ